MFRAMKMTYTRKISSPHMRKDKGIPYNRTLRSLHNLHTILKASTAFMAFVRFCHVFYLKSC